MSRRHLIFSCEGARLVGTIDEAARTTGLLIISGGNEVRSGAWGGQAWLAARLAAHGFPVFRFDRRGIGDSEGANGEFRTAGPDIAAALEAFRAAAPQLNRVVALGNCDAASALMLNRGGGCDSLILSNPWTIEQDGDEEAPPEVLRAHYRRRLASPEALRRLFTGQIPLSRLAKSLVAALRRPPPPTTLAQEMADGLRQFSGPVTLLVAERDRTALAFLAAWKPEDERIRRCPQASHSYVEPDARAWFEAQVLEALAPTGM